MDLGLCTNFKPYIANIIYGWTFYHFTVVTMILGGVKGYLNE